jgi:DNA-binding transcriptional ArsR family regulator
VADSNIAQEMQNHAQDAARLLKALANESRLMILCSLVQNELNVSELNDRVVLSQSALSQHLAWLRRENLVQTRRDAQTIYYSLQGSNAKEVIQVLQSIYCPHLTTQ